MTHRLYSVCYHIAKNLGQHLLIYVHHCASRKMGPQMNAAFFEFGLKFLQALFEQFIDVCLRKLRCKRTRIVQILVHQIESRIRLPPNTRSEPRKPFLVNFRLRQGFVQHFNVRI